MKFMIIFCLFLSSVDAFAQEAPVASITLNYNQFSFYAHRAGCAHYSADIVEILDGAGKVCLTTNHVAIFDKGAKKSRADLDLTYPELSLENFADRCNAVKKIAQRLMSKMTVTYDKVQRTITCTIAYESDPGINPQAKPVAVD